MLSPFQLMAGEKQTAPAGETDDSDCQPAADDGLSYEDAFKPEHVPVSWRGVFTEARHEIGHALNLVSKVANKSPAPHRVTKPFWLTPLSKVRVVIFTSYAGKDGFPLSGRDELQPALNELREDASKPVIPWALQGVLMLNHQMLAAGETYDRVWLGFYQYVLDAVRQNNKFAVVLLMNAPALMGTQFDTRRCVLANSLDRAILTKAFRRVNELLTKADQGTIDW